MEISKNLRDSFDKFSILFTSNTAKPVNPYDILGVKEKDIFKSIGGFEDANGCVIQVLSLYEWKGPIPRTLTLKTSLSNSEGQLFIVSSLEVWLNDMLESECFLSPENRNRYNGVFKFQASSDLETSRASAKEHSRKILKAILEELKFYRNEFKT